MTGQAVCAQQPAEAECRLGVVIFGAVRTPIRVELRRFVRLSELLVLAGGPTEAAGKTITVTRFEWGPTCATLGAEGPIRKQTSVEVYDLGKVMNGSAEGNPFVNPGDLVTVFQTEHVHVVGNVKTPRAIALKRPMTVSQAIGLAGGVLSDSRTVRVMVIRRRSGDLPPTNISVDLKAIEEHRAEDVSLQPGDIIDVPSNKQRRDSLSPPIYDAPPPQQGPSRTNVFSS